MATRSFPDRPLRPRGARLRRRDASRSPGGRPGQDCFDLRQTGPDGARPACLHLVQGRRRAVIQAGPGARRSVICDGRRAFRLATCQDGDRRQHSRGRDFRPAYGGRGCLHGVHDRRHLGLPVSGVPARPVFPAIQVHWFTAPIRRPVLDQRASLRSPVRGVTYVGLVGVGGVGWRQIGDDLLAVYEVEDGVLQPLAGIVVKRSVVGLASATVSRP
jgi:hypothetical protein